jgi:hypothetical protein
MMRRYICISSFIVCILLTGNTINAKCPTDSSEWCKSIATAKDCNVNFKILTKLIKIVMINLKKKCKRSLISVLSSSGQLKKKSKKFQ